MTFRIKASVAKAAGLKDYAATVTEGIRHLEDHAAHMAEVAQGRAQAYPAPSLHPLVTEAIYRENGKFLPDFEVEDDSADIAARELLLKKQAAMHRVSQLEAAAVQAIIPHGKRRLHNMKCADAMNTRQAILGRDAARESYERSLKDDEAKPEIRTSMDTTTAKAALDATQKALDAVLAVRGLDEKDVATWKPEDDHFVDVEAPALSRRISMIERHGAELHAEIEDLSAEAIDKWSPQPFPT